MPERDTWVRITLRMPGKLHRKLCGASGAKSLNAEIVLRLEESFGRQDTQGGPGAASLESRVAELEKRVTKLEGGEDGQQ